MLTKFLRAASGAGEKIEYVGGYVQGFEGTTNNITVTLTSLTGGLATQPAAGDFVIIYFGTGSTTDRNLAVSGYSEVVELYSSDTIATSLKVAFKFMTGTPDTSITLTGGTQSNLDAGAVYVSVWRNVNTTSPFDVDATTATGNNSVLCNPPAITPANQGSIVVSGGSGGHNAGTRTYSSSNLTEFLSAGGNDTNDVTIGGGYNVWTSGSFDPAQFTFSAGDSSSFSWAAATLALRNSNIPPVTLQFVTSASNSSTDNTTTITAPSGILAGDIIIFSNYVANYTSGTVPSGFTNLVLTEITAVDHRTSYKIADGTESGTTITGMTGSDFACVLAVFRLSQTPTVSTGTWNSEGTDADPASQTVVSPTTKPVIVFYAAGSRDSIPSFSSQTPTLDGTISAGPTGNSLLVGYAIYTFGAPSYTADVADTGNRNTFHSGYLALT